MSNALFPCLPGLTWDITYSPAFDNVEQRSKNGAVTVLMNDPYPQWSVELNYEFLRDSEGRPSARNPKNYPELKELLGFFLQRGGNADTFLIDPELLTDKPEPVAAHQIGTGDGATTVFYLMRDIGGFAMEVQDPIPGSVKISADGTPVTSGWTLGTKGDITFASAPAADAVITASFRWRLSVRFAQSSLEYKAFMFDLYEADSVKLIQDKR